MILSFNWEIRLLPSFEQTPKTHPNFKTTTWTRLLILSTVWDTPNAIVHFGNYKQSYAKSELEQVWSGV